MTDRSLVRRVAPKLAGLSENRSTNPVASVGANRAWAIAHKNCPGTGSRACPRTEVGCSLVWITRNEPSTLLLERER